MEAARPIRAFGAQPAAGRVRHGIPVTAVVGNDAGWTQIAREQVKMLKDDVGTVLARTDYQVAAASARTASW